MSFDHVVFACHSDQALRMLGDDATANERDLLGCFPYEKNIAVLHRDRSLLPRSGELGRVGTIAFPKTILERPPSPIA